jgi:uncharacterized phage protein gp47/JayE
MAIVTHYFDDVLGTVVLRTFQELFDSKVLNEKAIFTNDTNYETNSPDGQRVLLDASSNLDVGELIQSTFLSFFLENATGIALDYAAQRKGLSRKAGAYSQVVIDITVDRSLTLDGLDGDISNLNGTGYTVKDTAGNRWILTTTSNLNIGTTALFFRSATLGTNTADPNTLTIPETIVVGVTSVNNPASQISIGTSEENDTQLRARVKASAANNASINASALYSQLFNLSDVTDVKVSDNSSSGTDANGTPPHTVWAIVEGGLDNDIATVISKNTSGGGTRGAVSVIIQTPLNVDYLPFNFDRPISTPLSLQIDILTLIAGTVFDEVAIKNYIVTNLTFTIGKGVTSEDVILVAKDAVTVANGAGSGAVNAALIDAGGGFLTSVTPSTPQHKFTLLNIT